MPITFDSAIGIHEKSLMLYAQRAELLASNIANADTPGFKAKDIDFKSTLENIHTNRAHELKATHARHIQLPASNMSVETQYRIPNQPSLDGNTVDSQLEKSAFAENALRYQASLTFLDGKLKGIMSALKGE